MTRNSIFDKIEREGNYTERLNVCDWDRGRCYHCEGGGTCPTFDPDFILKKQKDKEEKDKEEIEKYQNSFARFYGYGV